MLSIIAQGTAHPLPGYVPWIILLPALAGLIQNFFGRKLPRQGDWLVVLAMVGSFVLSVMTTIAWLGLPQGDYFRSSANWFELAQGVKFDVGLMVDGLTSALLIVVTLVASLVFLFSSGYMKGDPYYHRFFFWLSFFGVAMLILTLADNLLMLFVGWEGVGLCSYLLISFWFDDEANAAAGKKAFVVNRIGDFGFLLGMFLIGTTLLPHLGEGEGVAQGEPLGEPGQGLPTGVVDRGIQRGLQGGLVDHAHVRQAHAVGREHPREGVDQDLLHAQRLRHPAGQLAGGAAEAGEHVPGHVIAPPDGDALDGVGHVLHGDPEVPLGHRLRRAAHAGRQRPELRLHDLRVEGQVAPGTKDPRKEGRLQTTEEHVGVGDGQGSTATVARRPRVGAGRFRANLEPAGCEFQYRAAAGGDRQDRQKVVLACPQT